MKLYKEPVIVALTGWRIGEHNIKWLQEAHLGFFFSGMLFLKK